MTGSSQPNIIVPVILSGGVGSRLWPLSRETHPKPFIRLDDGQSLIQKTFLRGLSIPNVQELITVTNRELFFYTKDEYAELESAHVKQTFILEPVGRNSAPAIATSAHYIHQKYGDDAIMVVFPADHLIQNQDNFLAALNSAVELAAQNKLVTFGITPNAPKTGYGYIETRGHEALRFVEKPDLATAKIYLEKGNFLWNSGIFCFSASQLLQETKTHCELMFDQTQSALNNALEFSGDGWHQYELQKKDFSNVQDISIDYAILEKSEQVAVVPCDMDWSDIGSWIEFGALHPKDEMDNHLFGETLLDDVKRCVIHSESKVVAGIGLENLIIADTSDALLIADRSRIQEVRKIVKQLKTKNHQAYKFFPTVHRPWGSYTVLQESDEFKIKRIQVKPKASLSLQMHRHRSEHWVVVQGKAHVINGEKELTLQANQSTYIPVGNKHRLENHESEPLIMIEVQCGSYLGEDDIVRYDDVYGRIKETA